MITAESPNNSSLFNPLDMLGKKSKRYRQLNESWATFYRDNVLHTLPIEKVRALYCSDNGRPTKDLYTLVSLVAFQQIFDLTDAQTCFNLTVRLDWQTALNITDVNDSTCYVSPRTLWDFRHKLMANGLDKEIFDTVTVALAKANDVNLEKQRLDSVHINSNMKKLGRLALFIQVIKIFLKLLKRNHKELFSSVNPELVNRYMSLDKTGDQFNSYFGRVKPSESSKTLGQASKDLYALAKQFENQPEVTAMTSFQHIKRVLDEQCVVVPAPESGEATVEPKNPKDIPANSLQNPSDEDATFSGHKGQGYHAQIMETYADTRDDENAPPAVKLITHVVVEAAHVHDSHAVIPAIEDTQAKDLAPKEITADTAYGSDENVMAAAQMGVELLSPTAGKDNEGPVRLADFQTDDDGKVTACPEGHKPWHVNSDENNDTITVGFNGETCKSCPISSNCPVGQSGEKARLTYTPKKLRLSRRRAYEQTKEYKKRYSMRSGIEATNSHLDRVSGAKRLRYRGIEKIALALYFKALGVNIRRIAAINRKK